MTSIVTGMPDDGIDVSDEAMVWEWIDRCNARPVWGGPAGITIRCSSMVIGRSER